MIEHHLNPALSCPNCGDGLPLASSVFGKGAPSPGDASMCISCGEILVFDTDPPQAEVEAGVCVVCGCTDDDACGGSTGWPCRWVARALCSACTPEHLRLRRPTADETETLNSDPRTRAMRGYWAMLAGRGN